MLDHYEHGLSSLVTVIHYEHDSHHRWMSHYIGHFEHDPIHIAHFDHCEHDQKQWTLETHNYYVTALS